MTTLTMLYILNASLIILHEMESAYEREWEILRLPGKIKGFLIIHIPLILVLFYGAVEIDRLTTTGLVIGIISGIGGMTPFLVHKILVRREDRFNNLISHILIYGNIITGAAVALLSGLLII